MKTAEDFAIELSELSYTHNFDLSQLEKIDNTIFVSCIEQRDIEIFKLGMKYATKIADDYDGKGMDSKNYYDQGGDAKLTQKDIVKNILTTVELITELPKL